MEIFRPAPLRLHRFFLSFSGRATIVSPVVSMKLIGCQFDLAWENQPANYAAVRRLLAAAPPPRGALVALPEMFATGFSMHVEAIVQPPGGPTEQFLAATARELGIYLVGGVVTPGAHGRGRNEAVVFQPDGTLAARYAKLHSFSPAEENQHYEPGNEVVMFDWAGIPAAVFICYDLRFPEVFRAAAARGAKLLVVIANWPTSRVDHWLALLTARAIENQAYVLGVNRCGATPKLEYPGRSVIVDPRGRTAAAAGAGEGLIEATPDWAALESYRREFAILPDMRPDFVPQPQPRRA